MYRVAAVLIVLLVSAAPVRAAPSHLTEFSSLEAVQKWMYGYRARPEPGRVPDAKLTLRFRSYDDFVDIGAGRTAPLRLLLRRRLRPRGSVRLLARLPKIFPT